MKVVPYNEPVPEIPVKAETTTPAEVSAVEQPAKKVPVSGRVAKMEVKHAKEMQKQALNAHKEQAKALKEQASKQTKAEAALKKEATAKNKADVEVEKLKTKAAEKAAQEAKEDVKRIHKQMADLEKQVQREAAEEAKAQVKAKPKYKKELHIEDLIKLKSNLNEIRNEGIPANAKTFFNREYATIKKMIDEYGKRNPTFKVAHEIAEDVHGGLTNASKVNAFMQKHITATRLGLGTIALLIGHGVGWHHPVTWGALGVAGGARYGLQSIEALMRSPNMRKYYGNVVKAAVKKDVPVMLKQANNLDKVMKAEEKKNAPKSEGEFIVYS
jgi:chemotaxis protein histidine kinase CheA